MLQNFIYCWYGNKVKVKDRSSNVGERLNILTYIYSRRDLSCRLDKVAQMQQKNIFNRNERGSMVHTFGEHKHHHDEHLRLVILRIFTPFFKACYSN